jgi:hypothetical protein
MISTTIDMPQRALELPFPKLMTLREESNQKNKLIVLFRKEQEGTIVNGDTDWQVGASCCDFVMHAFEDFKGSVKLENKQ